MEIQNKIMKILFFSEGTGVFLYVYVGKNLKDNKIKFLLRYQRP